MPHNRPPHAVGARLRSRSIDGLVGLSIAILICTEIGIPGFSLGRRILSVLLVVAGYLTTCAIVRTFDANHGAHPLVVLRVLWQRLRHVWPSLFCVIALAAAICGPLNIALLAAMKPDVVPALGFFANWTDLIRNATPSNSPSPLGYMWFPSLEMQLFVIWLCVAAFLQQTGKVWARRLTMIFSTLSAFWLVLQCVTGGNLVRVSFATDTRLCSYLFGAWLAFAFPQGRVPNVGKNVLLKAMDAPTNRTRRRRYQATPVAHVLGIISLAGIVGVVVALPEGGTLLSGISILVISLLTVTLIASLLAPGSLCGRMLALSPFTWLGSRALCIYLWLHPLFCIVTSGKEQISWPLIAAAVIATLVAGELTYRLVLLPFASPATAGTRRQSAIAPYRLATVGLIIVIAAVFGAQSMSKIPTEAIAWNNSASSVTSPSNAPSATQTTLDTAKQTNDDSSAAAPEAKEKSQAQSTADSASKDAATASSSSNKGEQIGETTKIHASPDETKNGRYDPVLIGDSVPGDADWSRLPDILLDTYIGRRPDQAIEVMRGYLDQDAVGKVVVLACFSNITPTADELDTFAALLGSQRQIYVVGTVNPDGFMDEANQVLKDAAERYDNVHYVDWPAVAKDHEKDYLWDDATHLRPEGSVAYANMVIKAIAHDIIAAGGTTE